MASKTKGDDATTTTTGSNILTRSKAFKTLVNKVFAACDTSKSGDVSKSEMYVGVLSVHLTLARYAGPAACYVSIQYTIIQYNTMQYHNKINKI